MFGAKRQFFLPAWAASEWHETALKHCSGLMSEMGGLFRRKNSVTKARPEPCVRPSHGSSIPVQLPRRLLARAAREVVAED